MSYMLAIGQRFDVVLNIDGFNEIYVGWQNAMRQGVAPSMPFAKLMVGQENLFAEEVRGPSPAPMLKSKRDYYTALAGHTRSAIVYFFSSLLGDYYGYALTRHEQALQTQQSELRYPVQLTSSNRYAADDIAEL